ncbi:DNA-directed RNA polymerase subunit alpha, partial [Candidatus Dojkabacteria bacterium]|nr:DNA-directed RNA polymerase subunit alpha [Candidatus Dojkabacteria bacterium]
MFPINEFKITVVSESDTEGVFSVGPLPKGYANTVGTVFRRILLSSIPGAAITSVKLNGVQHEYTTIAGLKDDVLSVVLAMKGIALVSRSDDPVTLKLNKKGEKGKAVEVTAADLEKNPLVDVINPDYVITTLADEKAKLDVEVTVEKGIGYSLPQEEKREEVGMIPVDAIFSPIKLVAVDAKNARVGQQTDLDALEVRIVTN